LASEGAVDVIDMWQCNKCGEKIEDQFDSCWKCGTPKAGVQTDAVGNPNGVTEAKKTWRLAYKYFRGGTLTTWDELFGNAAKFATEVGSEYVVGISHSADQGDAVVTVWYWTQADETTNH
jgi:hypothetical protein